MSEPSEKTCLWCGEPWRGGDRHHPLGCDLASDPPRRSRAELESEVASLRAALAAARAEARREALEEAADVCSHAAAGRYAIGDDYGAASASRCGKEIRALAAPGSPPPAGDAAQPEAGDGGVRLREALGFYADPDNWRGKAGVIYNGPGASHSGWFLAETALSEGRERIRAEGEDGR